MTLAVLASIVLTGIWTLILVWQQECRHGEKGPGCLSSQKKSARQDWVNEREQWRDDSFLLEAQRCCTLKCLWSSRLYNTDPSHFSLLCGVELLCCGKLSKAEWKGPFIMRKWHNIQSLAERDMDHLKLLCIFHQLKHKKAGVPAEYLKTINDQFSGRVSLSLHHKEEDMIQCWYAEVHRGIYLNVWWILIFFASTLEQFKLKFTSLVSSFLMEGL